MLHFCYQVILVVSFVTSTFEQTFLKVIAMKNYCILILTILMMGMLPQIARGYSVHVKGRWGENIIRTIFPKEPEVSVNSSVLSIYCPDAISDLTIEVVSADGNVILKESVTISSGETVHFTLSEITGTYQVRLNHEYGYLVGDFVI